MKNIFYDKKLSNLVINNIPLATDKMFIISGYIGPKLVKDLIDSIIANKNSKINKVEIYIGMLCSPLNIKFQKVMQEVYCKWH